jgi:DNA-directed RNA polymerase subunit RPC12/RpoP
VSPHRQNAEKCEECGSADLALIGRYLDGENRRRKVQHWVYRCMVCGQESKEITFRIELSEQDR